MESPCVRVFLCLFFVSPVCLSSCPEKCLVTATHHLVLIAPRSGTHGKIHQVRHSSFQIFWVAALDRSYWRWSDLFAQFGSRTRSQPTASLIFTFQALRVKRKELPG